MINMTHASAVEVIAQWYTPSLDSTKLYPVTDDANPLRTSTDAELVSILGAAARRGLRTVLTPMVDLDVTLPNLTWCYAVGCGWRGEIGKNWPDACGAGSLWSRWWEDSYAPFILKYAQIANGTNATAFLVQHELNTAAAVCPERWLDLITRVRTVYTGLVSAAFLSDILTPEVQAKPGVHDYVTQFDFLGVDCYTGPGTLPLVKYGRTSYPHAALPWQDWSLSTLVAAKRKTLPAYAETARWAGMQIVCTEVGFAARPWSYGGGYTQGKWPLRRPDDGHTVLDPGDCSVISQCTATRAQALAYEAFIDAFYAAENPWFDGALFWLWRADPTAGGLSDDGFVVAGKPAAAVIEEAWRGGSRATGGEQGFTVRQLKLDDNNSGSTTLNVPPLNATVLFTKTGTTKNSATTTVAALQSSCPDKILPSHSVYKGGMLVASTNVSDQGACCALCHGPYHDECEGWEWIDTSRVHANHNCDVYAKLGPPTPGYPGRVSGVGKHALPPAPPAPPPGPVGAACHSDGDCEATWGTRGEWRCLEDRAAAASPPRDCAPKNCSWGLRNILDRKSLKSFLGPDNIVGGPNRVRRRRARRTAATCTRRPPTRPAPANRPAAAAARPSTSTTRRPLPR
jgi:hypothetical protein